MRAVVQRVLSASVIIDGVVVGRIGPGLLVLVGAHKDDTETNAKRLADRIAGMRIFGDSDGKMNLALSDRQVLAVSNFTVYGDAMVSRRPSFTAAAQFEQGRQLFDQFIAALRALNVNAESGEFGADMQISLINDGPITIVVEC